MNTVAILLLALMGCALIQAASLNAEYSAEYKDVKRQKRTAPDLCTPGNYHDKNNKTLCYPCPFGQYQPASNQPSCVKCDAGTFSNVTGAKAASTCEKCKAGQTSTAGGTCMCPAGKYADTAAGGACTACAPGSCSTAGMTACMPREWLIVIGELCPKVRAAAVCTFCPAGKYADTAAGGACTNCPAGQTSVAGGPCTACAPGSCSAAGMTACISRNKHCDFTPQPDFRKPVDSHVVNFPCFLDYYGGGYWDYVRLYRDYDVVHDYNFADFLPNYDVDSVVITANSNWDNHAGHWDHIRLYNDADGYRTARGAALVDVGFGAVCTKK